MGTRGRELVRDLDPAEIAATLDSFYCYHLSVMHWTHAVANRLEGQALFLLGDETAEVAAESLEKAGKLADRVAELGGAITADPTDFVARSPIEQFSLPGDFGDPATIVGYALEQVRVIISAYSDFLDRVRGKDELTYHLVLRLLASEVSREDEMEGVLA